MTDYRRGCIREEECSGHKYVEWEVAFEWLLDENAIWSPTFKIGGQEYCLISQSFKLNFRGKRDDGYVDLKLVRSEVFKDDKLRCYMGVKHRDGSYYHDIQTEVVDLKTLIVCKQLHQISFLKRVCLDPARHVSFFIRRNLDGTNEGRQTCKHGVADIITFGEGQIREESCSGHKHLEWDVAYYLILEGIVTSPSFMIGEQRYLLEIDKWKDICGIQLYRMGPSVEQPVRCIVGTKRADGSYDHRVRSTDLNLSEEGEMWSYLGRIYEFPKSGIDRFLVSADWKITFLVRIDTGYTQVGDKACTHGVGVKSPSSAGSVNEVEWTAYKQVNWNVDLKPLSATTTSPSFSVGNQNYLWELRFEKLRSPTLSLYRRGPSVQNSVKWWSVLNRIDECSYNEYEDKCGSLNLADETYSIWQPVGIQHPLLINLDLELPLVVKLLMKVVRTSTSAKTSTPDDHHSQQHLEPVRAERVLFRLKEQRLKIDKVILAFRVPGFKTMFAHDCMESRTGVVDIEDCEPDVFHAFLRFVLTGNVAIVTPKNCLALYALAHKYMFDTLKRPCLWKVVVSRDNVFDVAIFCWKYKLETLLNKVKEFVSVYCIIGNTEWLDFCRNNSDVANDLFEVEIEMTERRDRSQIQKLLCNRV